VPHIRKGIKNNKSWEQSTQIHHRYKSSASLRRSAISEIPDSFTLDCDEEEENATEEKLQHSTSRCPEFSLKVTCPQSHKIMQKEISDPIKDLQLTNDTAGPFIQVHNSGIFWMTYESESISLTAKIF
jgi:hypothetical protein